MTLPGPVLPVAGTAAAALFTRLLSPWPRLSAAAGAAAAWVLMLWIEVIPLAPTPLEASSRWFSGGRWQIGASALVLTEDLRSLLIWLALAAAILLTAAAFFPEKDNLATAVLAMITVLAVSLMIQSRPLGLLGLAAAVSVFLLFLRPARAAAATAAGRWLTLAVLAAAGLLAAEWMLVEAPAPLAVSGRIVLAAGGIMLLAGFPFHLWVAPVVECLPPLAATAVFGLGAVGMVAFLSPLFQTYLASPGSAPDWLLWSGVATVLVGGLTAATAVSGGRLLGGLVLLDMGMSLLAMQMPGGQPDPVRLGQARFYGLLLALLGLQVAQRQPGLGTAGRLASLFGSLSLLGLPLTMGFDGRWRLLQAVARGNYSEWAAPLLLAGMAAGLLGIGRTFTKAQAADHEGNPGFLPRS